jgi:hypothetical protein
MMLTAAAPPLHCYGAHQGVSAAQIQVPQRWSAMWQPTAAPWSGSPGLAPGLFAIPGPGRPLAVQVQPRRDGAPYTASTSLPLPLAEPVTRLSGPWAAGASDWAAVSTAWRPDPQWSKPGPLWHPSAKSSACGLDGARHWVPESAPHWHRDCGTSQNGFGLPFSRAPLAAVTPSPLESMAAYQPAAHHHCDVSQPLPPAVAGSTSGACQPWPVLVPPTAGTLATHPGPARARNTGNELYLKSVPVVPLGSKSELEDAAALAIQPEGSESPAVLSALPVGLDISRPALSASGPPSLTRPERERVAEVNTGNAAARLPMGLGGFEQCTTAAAKGSGWPQWQPEVEARAGGHHVPAGPGFGDGRGWWPQAASGANGISTFAGRGPSPASAGGASGWWPTGCTTSIGADGGLPPTASGNAYYNFNWLYQWHPTTGTLAPPSQVGHASAAPLALTPRASSPGQPAQPEAPSQPDSEAALRLTPATAVSPAVEPRAVTVAPTVPGPGRSLKRARTPLVTARVALDSNLNSSSHDPPTRCELGLTEARAWAPQSPSQPQATALRLASDHPNQCRFCPYTSDFATKVRRVTVLHTPRLP